MNALVKASEIVGRAAHLIATGSTRETAAAKLNAEFHAATYVSNGRLWASCLDFNGKPTARVIA